MKAYEFTGEVTANGQLKLPETALSQLAGHQAVKVIVIVQESSEAEEKATWQSLATEQFLAEYSSEDAIYDTL